MPNILRHCARLILLMVLFRLESGQVEAALPFVHPLFSSHMVLQRDATDPVWGWAGPGVTVTVVVKDQNATVIQTSTAVADTNGRWQASVGPFPLVTNNAAYSLTISASGQTTVTLSDVLIGDVWLCAGQSNMAYSMNTIGVTNAAQETADSINYPSLRCFTVPEVEAATPQTNLNSTSWQVVNPSDAANITACGYFTAREIYKQQGIPIGILCSAWPGTEIESWVDAATATNISEFIQTNFDQTLQSPARGVVAYLYNAMIAPLPPFHIKAVEWYQGEYNTAAPEQYSRLLPALISQWRNIFSQPSLPFVIIQLPNFGSAQTLPVETGSWAELREAQLKTVLNDSQTRIVTTIDIGNGDLHPVDKQDVGLRAARAAADLVYGQSSVDEGPIMRSVSLAGANAICTFDHVGSGLMVASKSLYPLSPAQPIANGNPGNFALAGANHVFYAANASITASNQVTVSSPQVPAPLYVRYGWGGNPPCNLYNEITDTNGNVIDGLPASPFRNDPVNKIMVNLGTGTGYFASNSVVSIVASTLTGQQFTGWSGDTGLIGNANSASTTATQSQEYVSVLANYLITGAPSGFSATGQPAQIALGWNPMTAVHYNVKRANVSAGPFVTIASNLVNLVGYIDSNVSVGSTYYYAISAVNMFGEGPNSTPVSATVLPGIPVTTNIWDANGATAPNPTDGSGNWLTTGNWWTGTTSVNGHWTNGAATDSAILGAGASGNYLINLGGSTIYASNLTFNTSTYALTNGAINLLSGGNPVTVNAGITGVISVPFTTAAGNSTLSVTAGGILDLTAGAAFSGNLIMGGGGTVDMSGGTFNGSNFALWLQTVATQEAATLNTVRIMVGYGGNSTFTMNSASAVASSTGGGGDSFIARSGSTGTWDLKQGTIQLTALGGDNLRVGYDSNGKATLLVEGGLLDLGANILYVNYGSVSSGGIGTVNLSGGRINAGGLQFGGGTTFGTGTSAVFLMSGGTLYVGSGGIATNYTGTLATSILLSGGTIGASAAWSSSMGMTLTNGNVILQAADASATPRNIILSGKLAGTGAATITGGGTVTLAGPNTYFGGTTIAAGNLNLTTTNNAAMAYTNSGGTLNLRVAVPDHSMVASNLAFGSAGSHLGFDMNSLVPDTVPVIHDLGNLDMAGNVSVDVSNLPPGSAGILSSYDGVRTGAGSFTANLLPAGTMLVDDQTNKRVVVTFASTNAPVVQMGGPNGSALNFRGTNGTAYTSYRVLAATNLNLPMNQWTQVQTNTFDRSGNFSNSVPINPTNPAYFLRVITP